MKKYIWILFFIVSLITLPFIVLLAQRVQTYLSRASDIPANITVDWNATGSPLPKPWQALAQGGEEPPPMLSSVVPEIKALDVKYIRIDHMFDMYAHVSKRDGQIIIDFTKLDETVNDITKAGALPLFSLSYTPPSFTSDGNITSPPPNWSDWTEIVRRTVERYSGKNGKNLSQVYYEVWNEPDLFGGYKISGDRDYRILYLHTVNGVTQAANVNPYLVGGPATTGMYPNWMDKLLAFCRENNLRIDFLSWHRYSQDPLSYKRDIEGVRSVLSKHPEYATLPLLITEWGIDSENNPFHDSQVSAAHTIASIGYMIGNIQYAYSFEVKDGPSPNNDAFWGRWGLITHDSAGLYKKPRYYALQLLNSLNGQALLVQGQGSNVTAIGTRDGDVLKLIVTNFDPKGYHSENVPVTFSSLSDASYILTTEYLNGTSRRNEFSVTTGTLSQNFLMNANDIILLTLTKAASLASFIPGPSGQTSDQALDLTKPYTVPAQSFRLGPTGSLSFDFRPTFDTQDGRDRVIFEIPFSSGNGVPQKLAMQKKLVGFSNKLVFGVFDQNDSQTVTANYEDWSKDTWKRVLLSWSPTDITISLDGKTLGTLKTPLSIRNGSNITFFSGNGAIDNLTLTENGRSNFTRSFDGSLDR